MNIDLREKALSEIEYIWKYEDMSLRTKVNEIERIALNYAFLYGIDLTAKVRELRIFVESMLGVLKKLDEDKL